MRLLCIALLLTFSVSASGIITIATGSTSGLYYATGGAICRIFNLSSTNGSKCIVESTPGSSYNLNAAEGTLNSFALVQADELHKYLETKKQESKPSTIATVLPLYTETFVLVVSKNSGITTINDIANKKFNIGVEGSGVRNFTATLLKHLKLKSSSFKKITTESQSAIENSICNNTIDATIFVSGQPNPTLNNLIEKCDAKIIPLPQDFITSITNNNPYYSLAEIPAGMYVNHTSPIQTVGTQAILITSQETESEDVYNLVNNILVNFESFKQYSPVMQTMSTEELQNAISQLPLIHASAIKAFKNNQQ